MSEEAGQRYRQTVFVDYASPRVGDVGFGKRRQIGGVTLADGTFAPNPGAHICFSKLTIGIHQDEALQFDWRPPEGGSTRSQIVARGQALFVDAQLPVWKRWQRTRSMFAVALDEGFFAQIANEAFDGKAEQTIGTAIGVDDPAISRLLTLAQQELSVTSAGGRLYIEGLGTSLAIHVLRRYGCARRPASRSKGGLAPAQLGRVIAYIEAHLGDEIGLLELSSVAELSPHHFGDAFKTSTGAPPHRYVIARRLDRARQLLRDNDRPLGEIAYSVGFSSQAHFTTQFRRATGVTPGRFRRLLR
jgi:AraC family transcriptional regulator